MIRELGLTVTVGSDAGIGPPSRTTCSRTAPRPWSTAGARPVEALTAITVTAARSCRVDDRKGTIRTGYDADLLAVRGDPTTDIDALLEIEAVYRAGVHVAGPSSRPPSSGIPTVPPQRRRRNPRRNPVGFGDIFWLWPRMSPDAGRGTRAGAGPAGAPTRLDVVDGGGELATGQRGVARPAVEERLVAGPLGAGRARSASDASTSTTGSSALPVITTP